MSEKLTVAELLARNNRGSSDSSSNRPRRRRRNLEEGGVSVAELTGSIPVVTQKNIDDSKAADGKSAAETAEKNVASTTKPSAAPKQQSAPVSAPKQTPAPDQRDGEKIVDRKAMKPGESTGEMKAVPDSVDTAAKRPKQSAAKTGSLAEARKEESSLLSGRKSAEGKTAKKKDTAKKDAENKDVEKKDVEKSAAGTKLGEKTATAVPAGRKAAKAKTRLFGRKAAKAEDKKPADRKDEQKPVDQPVAQKVGDTAEKKGAGKKAAVAGAAGAAAASAAVPSAKAKKDEDRGRADRDEERRETTGRDARGLKDRDRADRDDKRRDVQARPAHEHDEFAELEANLADDEVIDYEDNTISWPMMLAQAIGAIVAGVGIFFGFSLLWNTLPAIFVLVLALAMTLLLVGLVHALLRHNDKMLMLLAFVVGLVLTFGPRLIMGI